MTGTIKLIRNILLMVIQHGGDDVSCKPRIAHFVHVMTASLISFYLTSLVLSSLMSVVVERSTFAAQQSNTTDSKLAAVSFLHPFFVAFFCIDVQLK